MPRGRPPVSIGLPVRNGADFLSEALDSLLAQTMGDFELLISDNASEDDTQEISREAARDPRVTYVHHGINVGAAANYNYVFHQTRGEFFRWASHDDVSTPTHLERCLATYRHGPPDTVLVYPRTLLIDGAGDPITVHDDRLEMIEPSARRRLQTLARNWGLCNPVMGLMRRSAAERTRLIDTFASSDLVFLAELALQGRVLEVPEVLFHRRIHAGSAMQGTGDIDPALWLDPNAVSRSDATRKPAAPRLVQRRASTLPLLREILSSVRRSELPPQDRAQIAVGLSFTWLTKRARVHLGAAKRSLLGKAPAGHLPPGNPRV